NANHVMNYEMIRWGLEEEAEQYDFGGFFEIGDGLYQFKKSFCDKDGHVEYIGEINKIYKPFVYNMLEKVIPMVKNFRKRMRRNNGYRYEVRIAVAKKTLGIIGGVGPLATMFIGEMIVRKTVAEKDQDHIHTIITNNSSIPDRTAFIL